MRRRALIGAGVGAFGAWRLLGPQTGRRRQPRLNPLPIPGRSLFTASGVEYFLRETGPVGARPLILIHGWVYDSLLTWHRLVPLLDDRLRIVLMDQRNHGGSERIHTRHSIETVADEIAEVMEVAGYPDADVMGYSMGGMVAMSLAHGHPARVRRLVLAATTAHRSMDPRLQKAVLVLGRALWRLSPMDGARVSNLAFRYLEAIQPEYSTWVWDRLLDRDPDLAYWGGRAIVDFDFRSRAGSLTQPVLVVIPTRDQLISPADQYQLAGLLAAPTVVELVGVGHEAVFTRAAEMAAAINEFLDKEPA